MAKTYWNYVRKNTLIFEAAILTIILLAATILLSIFFPGLVMYLTAFLFAIMLFTFIDIVGYGVGQEASGNSLMFFWFIETRKKDAHMYAAKGYGFYQLPGKSGIEEEIFCEDLERLSDFSYISYRILQNIFLIAITSISGVIINWKVSGAFVISWWFGLCDLLYYPLLKQKIIETHYSWLEGWSVHFIIKKIFPEYKASRLTFILFSAIGLIMSVVLIIFIK